MGVADREDDLDTESQEEVETIEGQAQEAEPGGGEGAEGEAGAAAGGEEDEDVVQIGSEEPPASEDAKAAAPWVKELRQRQKELARENAELKAKLGTGHTVQPTKPTLPPKPKMSDADIDYDEEKFERARDAWEAKKREIDAWEASQRHAQEAQQKATQAVHDAYIASRQALKVKDFQEAEDVAAAALDQIQQAIVKKGAANPAALVYALGNNPEKLQKLASIKDPVKFAVAIGKLETEVKVTKRTSTKPAPETTVKGSGSSSASKATLERLQAEADKTGDRSKVAAFIRQQRLAGQK